MWLSAILNIIIFEPTFLNMCGGYPPPDGNTSPVVKKILWMEWRGMKEIRPKRIEKKWPTQYFGVGSGIEVVSLDILIRFQYRTIVRSSFQYPSLLEGSDYFAGRWCRVSIW
jgi:hypothetical protein